MAAELGESERKLHDRFSAWDSFEFTSKSGGLELQQVDRKHFLLRSAIRYTGPLGIDVDADASETLRCVGPGEDGENALGLTDLASVPAPFRWWARSYGIHTPATLIHDRFIGEPDRLPAGVTERLVDTYFRKMLEESGVKPLRRWMMWAAVVSRTRLNSGTQRWAGMAAWVVASVIGIAALGWAVLFGGPTWALAVGLLLPFPASLLWGSQWRAGLIIALLGFPLLLPPALLAAPSLFLFRVADRTVTELIPEIREEFGVPNKKS